MKHLVVLSGAGISAESGISTFRDAGGLWEGHDIMEVATPQGWGQNPVLVQQFYNARRKQALTAQPNLAHQLLAQLEQYYRVTIVTQNVDDLHEKAGSSNVIHLHGQLSKCRSSIDESLVYDMDGWELKMGDVCEKGSQLRPHIVWFGEPVPMMEDAMDVTARADYMIIIGTSLQVYPAAGLSNFLPSTSHLYLIDPKADPSTAPARAKVISEVATVGMQKIFSELVKTPTK